jgi:hypothetical protein
MSYKKCGCYHPCVPYVLLVVSKKHMCKDGCYVKRFMVGVKEGKGGLYLKAWDSLCVPKSAEGLGLRRSADMNNALLAKLGWNVAKKDDKPWVRFMNAKYLRGKSFWSAKASTKSSWVWKSILSTRDTLTKGVCWRVNNGVGLDIWNALWVPNCKDFKPTPRVIGE